MEISKTYFDEVSKDWDKMQQSFFPPAVREKAYELAGIEKGKLAADIGAGTGFMTEGLLEADINVIAVDQSAEMLKLLNDKYRSTLRLKCIQGDSDALPLDAESVDYVFANMFLHHVNDPSLAIREMFRILKKGGKLVITDLDKHNHEFLVTEQHDVWMGFDRENVKKWFREAGFAETLTDCVGSNCCANSQCGCNKASISIFAALGIK